MDLGALASLGANPISAINPAGPDLRLETDFFHPLKKKNREALIPLRGWRRQPAKLRPLEGALDFKRSVRGGMLFRGKHGNRRTPGLRPGGRGSFFFVVDAHTGNCGHCPLTIDAGRRVGGRQGAPSGLPKEKQISFFASRVSGRQRPAGS